jgi:hypothetical protein
MPLRPNEFAARAQDRVEFRADPLRLRIDLADLVCSDHHDLRCVFECSARVGDHSADRQLFVELLMADRPAITREDVASHLRPALENAARSAVAQPVDHLLSPDGKASLQSILRNSADAESFNSGLILLPPFELDLASPSLQREQREAAQRSRVEEQAAGRVEHLRRAADLLKQFDSIRAGSPSISAGQVLERIAPADQGALLDAILASDADRAAGPTLYAVAGTALVRIDTCVQPPHPVMIELPGALGPLRSVQSATIEGDQRLLVGARGGVLLVDPRDPASAVAYAGPALASSLGFNRAIFLPASSEIFATHGEAGLVRWDLGDPSGPKLKAEPKELRPHAAESVRNIHALDRATAICSVGNALMLLSGSDQNGLPSQSSASIISIVSGSQRLFAIHEDGSVDTFDRETRRIIRHDTYGGTVCAAGGLPWLDGVRLLLASPTGPVDCVGPDDSLVTRYNSVYRGLRNVTASASCVAAVSPDRQRLILWDSWNGRAPANDLHLTSLTRHRIADVAFV